MAHFRVETEPDESSGLYRALIFYPAESSTPRIRTKARFTSQEAAIKEVMELMEQGLDKPVKVMKPN